MDLPPPVDVSEGKYATVVGDMVLTPDGKHVASTPEVDDLRRMLVEALRAFHVVGESALDVFIACNRLLWINSMIHVTLMDQLYRGDDEKHAGTASAHTELLVFKPIEAHTDLFKNVGFVLPTPALLSACCGKKILTIGCGRGLVDLCLGQMEDTTVISTDACVEEAVSDLPPFVADRKKMTASEAVAAHGDDADILLVCAPHPAWFGDLKAAIDGFHGTTIAVVNYAACLAELKDAYGERVKEETKTQSIMGLLDSMLVIQ